MPRSSVFVSLARFPERPPADAHGGISTVGVVGETKTKLSGWRRTSRSLLDATPDEELASRARPFTASSSETSAADARLVADGGNR